MNAAFSDKALRAAEPYIIQHADRWCELLLGAPGKEWTSPTNLAEWSDYLVFDILGMYISSDRPVNSMSSVFESLL